MTKCSAGQLTRPFRQVFVQTERPLYHSGDLVTGTIYVNVVQSFDCTGLELHVS